MKTASDTIAGASQIPYYSSGTVSNYSLTYACSVVALSNLMKYYRSRGYSEIDSNFGTLYTKLWNYAGTSSSGSTTNGNEAPAAKQYLNSLGYPCLYSQFSNDNYSNFTQAVMLDKPCILTYGAEFNGASGGHAVFVVGYVATSSYQYLRIADGWNANLRYINYNGYNYTRIDGWSFAAS